MATLEDVYGKIASDDEEKKAFAEAFVNKKMEEFLAQRDCEATVEEFFALLKSKEAETKANGEMSEEELESASGGAWRDWVTSFCSLGLGCAVVGLYSMINSDFDPDHYYNTAKEYWAMCDYLPA